MGCQLTDSFAAVYCGSHVSRKCRQALCQGIAAACGYSTVYAVKQRVGTKHIHIIGKRMARICIALASRKAGVMTLQVLYFALIDQTQAGKTVYALPIGHVSAP